MIVLRWYWRYHHLGVEAHASIEEAVRVNEAAEDHGSSSLDHIEVIDAGYAKRLTAEEYDTVNNATSPPDEPSRVITHRVQVLFLGTDPAPPSWVNYEWNESHNEAAASAAALTTRGLAKDRVRIVKHDH